MTGAPLVTLGMPVRNGAATLRSALDSMVNQNYPNLEIVISDNASDDATPDILRDYAARYSFIRIFRYDVPITIIDNFLFLTQQARGEFFAWCAHDDTRSADFVSGLLPAFRDPRTVLAFGDLYTWDGHPPLQRHPEYDFANDGLPMVCRLRKAAHMQCYHFYGLWRLSALQSICYRYTHWWSDLPLLLAASTLGQFRHVPGPQFHYYEILKTAEQSAAYHHNRSGNQRIENFAALFSSILITVWRTAGLWPALIATAWVAEKYVREAFRRIGKQLGDRA